MPRVRFLGREIGCASGARLRDVLLHAGLTPHNGGARQLNCRGFGTCGTCAVAIEGPVSAETTRERWRLAFPPHDRRRGLRLAYQARVLGDVDVTKFEGFWGERAPDRD